MAGEVELTPFHHKVGGKCHLLRYDEETVSKPFVAREYFFYKNAPTSLLPFLPEFRGIADVRFDNRPGSKDLQLLAVNIRSDLQAEESPPSSLPLCNEEDFSNLSEYEKGKPAEYLRRMNEDAIISCDVKLKREPCYDEQPSQYSQETLHKLKHAFENSSRHGNKIILLQNITCHHRRPCIMDIKIGTRLHNDDMPEEKKQLSIWRCNVSTSKDLALRMGGLKVYSPDEDCYFVMDKYGGRDLNIDGFTEAIRLFFSTYSMREIVQDIIGKLEQLYSSVSLSHQTRLYACSILLIYEGSSIDDHKRVQTDVKIIDFANASISGMDVRSPADGCIVGIKNLIEILHSLLR